MSFYIIDRTLAGTPRSDTARALPAFMNAHFIVGSALKRISLKAMTTRRARSKSKTVRKAANKVTIKKKANLLAKKRSSLSSSTTKSQTATPSNNSSFSSTNSSNKSNSAFKWQYEDGNWGDYDTDASDMVENCYQGWLYFFSYTFSFISYSLHE